MGYRDVHWYKKGINGWREDHNFVESSDYSYLTRKIPAPLTPTDLYQKLQTDDSYILVDIRDEINIGKQGSIVGPTVRMPLYSMHLDYSSLPENKILVLYDILGKQAPSAIRYLLNKRFYFINLTYLKGGVTAWKENNLPMAAK